jgi:ABC-type sugar transport system substrate-binding protein
VGAWTQASGHDAVRSWLETTRGFVGFDLIGAQNDDMAAGGRNAVAEAASLLGKPEWAKIPATGVDGIAEYGQRLVDDGTLAATIIMPTTTGRAIDLLVTAIRDGARPPAITTVPVTSYPQVSLLRPRA